MKVNDAGKRVLQGVFFLVIILAGVFLIKKFYFKDYNVHINDSQVNWRIKYKGLEGARDFTTDSSGSYYIAYKNRIQYIGANGSSYDLLKDDRLNINSIEYFDQKLYFSSDCKVICYDLRDKTSRELISDLPNFGDYKDSIIKLNGEYLYVSIGAATNSGVVGKDNKWLTTNTYYHDLSPFDITLKGVKFGEESTGSFTPYKTRNYQGQIITGHFPGNATVIRIDIKSGKAENFAWGIRNIKGMDFDSEGKLYASVGGMENRGLRPVQDDFDYLFIIKKGVWYGWPDYSGGDPITSPRFKGNKNSFIVDKQPTSNPPAPIYQNKYLGTLGYVAADKDGLIGVKDSIYFYDSKQNSIFQMDSDGRVFEKINFSSESNISSMKFNNSSLIVLDQKQGCLYEISKLTEIRQNKIMSNIFYGLITIIFVGILYIIKSYK